MRSASKRGDRLASVRTETPSSAVAGGKLPEDGRRRVVIEGVSPAVDGGRFAAKRIAGDDVIVEADVFADGHDALAAMVLWRPDEASVESDPGWREAPMAPVGNDRWRGSFPVAEPGGYRFTVLAWVDRFATWRHDLEKRLEAAARTSRVAFEKELPVQLAIGQEIVAGAASRAEPGDPEDADYLGEWAKRLGAVGPDVQTARAALSGRLQATMARHPDRSLAVRYPRELPVQVDRPRARFGAWYEFFPRSTGPADRHGTFADAAELLPEIAAMGFDIVYLPPIHPIGRAHRKGPNNAPLADPDDPGSPWAIGGPEGGHKALHPELGTLDDFRAFVAEARAHGLEVALDVAFQCSPDHPYVKQHPEWFRHRPDGSIQYAENPPKKYEDIVPFDFETAAWRELWFELKSVFDHWIDHDIRIFRVDNPHTKPFPFWEWVIGEIRSRHPDVIFLSEAFTRPRVMERLAKLGFTQSYTYFAWRNTKPELEAYLTQLTRTPLAEYFRPNFWPNTPDILTEYLQTGGRPAFVARLVLAATLASSYGIYGPAFELCEREPREPGNEEYLNSEKYQLRAWDRDRRESLEPLIARVNRIRRENPALQHDRDLVFHRIDNAQLIAFSKRGPADGPNGGDNVVLVVVNLDPHHVQSGWLDLDIAALGLRQDESYRVHDLLGGGGYLWHGGRNYVELNPQVTPAHVFQVARRARTERDFDYYL